MKNSTKSQCFKTNKIFSKRKKIVTLKRVNYTYYDHISNFYSSLAKHHNYETNIGHNRFSSTTERAFSLCITRKICFRIQVWINFINTHVAFQEQIEVNLNTFESKLNGSSIWCKIKDIETSPALSYNWNNSETQKVLLAALYVDSRNIVSITLANCLLM